ncbi:ubiquinone biosynthesis protein COQ9, mitochondrial isoform X2 [Cylas formicarius]|uniref:ubiquinone biosynthesis protein COQ9, mitochondrial isoform X2 n=1 Tax=Cylas formicarius TaxID=197179 RepID=UPI002958C2F5|nr:ubiquinone biosynthesis protein COQ9, mitochondrial isoform X2 [Cylas formicarius]
MFSYFLEDTRTIWMKCKRNLAANQSGEDYEEDIRNKILEASLPFVLELGWSREALSRGAQCVGYPGITHGIFTRGGGDLVHYFNTTSNLRLLDILKELRHSHGERAITPGQFAETAIRERLKMIVPYVSRWPQAIAVMSLPPNVPNALATLLTMVDDVCYYAGDRSVDFNWYIRRVGVAGVYKATELYLIQDKSPDQIDTWDFLRRRMEDAVQLNAIISKSDIASQGAKDVAKSAFITARNILGLSWNR